MMNSLVDCEVKKGEVLIYTRNKTPPYFSLGTICAYQV